MRRTFLSLTAAMLVFAAPVLAQALADGEVRRVDKEAKKLTIRHGPIPNLNMESMTMVFHVNEPAMLDQVKAGDKIRFQADKIGGQYTVTKIEPVK
jgi:Cu(I)/Ag(I) efflux system periplasmic protein CusF